MIHIQSDSKRLLPHHFDAACALYGAEDSALDFRLTSFEEMSSGKFDNLLKRNLFVGSSEFMMEVFKRMGCLEIPKVPFNCDRPEQIITLKMARETVAKGNKIFIKPIQNKLFTGFVLDESEYTCLRGIPEDTPIMSYEPFTKKLISEWRIYIHNNKIVDSRNYSGDFMVSPNYSFVQLSMKNNKEFPCAYTMDVGIFEDGSSTIVEYNDMWAIGNYGIPNDLYLRLLKDRYFEIVKSTVSY